jgi:uncharacterized protein YcbK (DUF882 family)
MTKLKYFTWEEFDSPDLPNSGKMFMDRDFVYRLDNARELAGVPFRINSGYRTKNRNIRVGGSPNSSHLSGLAADIAIRTSTERFLIVNALLECGFTRIGIADTFVHVDSSSDKVQNVIWTY